MKGKKIFVVNNNDQKRKMVQCVSVVNRKDISRKKINGVEHVIVSSYTLPDNVVMNDILYPAEEIAKGYKSLERTLAPIEHPTNSSGEYISANDPDAIHNFHAGAFNVNVTRANGRVHIEKHINVAEAVKTERGRRLLDRIDELETNAKPRPIHTSVGLFLALEKLDAPRTNAQGEQYSMIGKDFEFDHDAILLDSVGAATPSQGVGLAVNSKGQKINTDRVFVESAIKASTRLALADSNRTWDSSAALRRVKSKIGAQDAPNATYARYHLWYDAQNEENFGAYKLPFVDIVDGEAKAVPRALRNAAARLNQTDGPSAAEKTRIKNIIDGYLNKLRANQMSLSYTQMIEQLEQQIKNTVAADFMEIEDVYEDRVIFETGAGYFTVPYTVSGDSVTLAGIPIRVDKKVEYQPKINQKKGDEQMKQLILNALAEAGISTDGMSDDDLFKAYNELIASTKKDPTPPQNNNDDDALTKAINALNKRVEAIDAKLNANVDQEKADLITTIVNAKKYSALDEDAVKLLPLDTLKKMAASLVESHGVPFTMNSESGNDFAAPAEMPQ